MCSQTVSLVAAEAERRGITTVCVQLLRVIAESVRPPRGLLVPYPHGYPLGRPNDAPLQRRVLRALLDLANGAGPGPILREFGSA